MNWIEEFRDYYSLVTFGQLVGHTRVVGIGNNPDVDASEDVWSGGGNYPWMTAATSLEIVSASANDTSAGTGARTATINGLDTSYNEVQQVITLNGTTPVAVPTQLFRINNAIISSAGSGEVNAGDITIRDAGAGTTRAIIPAGYGTTRQAQYTVPAGYALSITSMVLSINRPTSVRDATVATFVRNQAGFYRMPLEITVNGNPYRHEMVIGIFLPEKTDFGLRCTNVSATNTDLTAGWVGVRRQLTRE